MRVEYINPFVEAAFNVLKEVLQADIRRGELYLKSTTMPVLGVAALVGLAGDVEGRVMFDMSKTTALAVASAMNGEQLSNFDELVKATITELANMITAQAVTKLHDLGFRFDLTPPALFTGDNMEVSDHEVEALIVPMETPQGKIEINVAIRERV
ncbi:MAG TPA: chemotaxis protein CheX [Termitinemataceae bacterium]|jgi:chemotaxis protein CheX|uniref:chemotaxis protein CheX n=1 Tax=Treponema sp. J25 TaxID=2094121 RepID=UPI001048388D|nr:chemotaxis protein CheX [Treponema sp. J25]MCX7655196.1 chemotaxis protein CheX [Treponemataceae bacterium]HOJ98549.1 chemotaxis protein CheX [Termitinemataceae bacterium]TCW60639.1 chemotaxis protein CheX [Treponema sp. J25]HOM22760.1 chemotaxis protein CheX [Termitinemataceae bacterium]HPQ00670.1 chemotaxis protein CheX [Termitinemataceae bacterium]